MQQFSNISVQKAVLFLVTASFALSACATKPERRGPPKDERKPGQHRQESGTFLLPIAPLYIAMDTDGDKKTSRAEMEQGTSAEWSTFARNPSAVYFNPWIIRTIGAADATPNFMSFDHDFNGVISKNEFSSHIEAEFSRLDRNKDNALEISEMIVAFSAPQGERSRKGEQGERGKGGKGGKGGGGRPSR